MQYLQFHMSFGTTKGCEMFVSFSGWVNSPGLHCLLKRKTLKQNDLRILNASYAVAILKV